MLCSWQRSPDTVQSRLKSELRLLEDLLKTFPKSYWLWNHRQWVLQTLPEPEKEILRDLKLVEAMLDLDSRNFHGWDYRRYLVAFRAPGITDGVSHPKKEFEYTTKKINQNFSNYSAWHYRSTVLPNSFAPSEIPAQLHTEFELVRSAIYTDPQDQSAWLYQRWLLGARKHDPISCLGAWIVRQPAYNGSVSTSFAVALVMSEPVLISTDGLISIDGSPVTLTLRPVLPNFLRGDTSEASAPSSLWLLNLPSDRSFLSEGSTNVRIVLDSNNVATPLGRKPRRRFNFELNFEGNMENYAIRTTSAASDAYLIASPFREIHALDEFTADTTLETLSEQWSPAPASKQVLLREIESLRELIDLEPESKWALLTLVILLDQLGDETAEQEHVLDKLALLDKARAQYYMDLKSRRQFNRLLSAFLKRREDGSEYLDFGIHSIHQSIVLNRKMAFWVKASRAFLAFVNVVFCVLGIAVIGFGIALIAGVIPVIRNMGLSTPIGIIIIGAIIFAISMLGAIGGIQRSRSSLIAYAVALSLFLVVEIALVVLCSTFQSLVTQGISFLSPYWNQFDSTTLQWVYTQVCRAEGAITTLLTSQLYVAYGALIGSLVFQVLTIAAAIHLSRVYKNIDRGSQQVYPGDYKQIEEDEYYA
ncbi:hypothetical protein HDU93_007834 [Gonapodya sp. JEL0774]|nr:hypothetical protein HDU93_007834 [Gonapodya sp. JEL0774]